mgnify:CR=1 FL=1
MVANGYDEEKILDWPIDKFYLCVSSVERRLRLSRKVMVADTAGAVGGLFTKGELKKYLKHLDGEDDGQ